MYLFSSSMPHPPAPLFALLAFLHHNRYSFASSPPLFESLHSVRSPSPHFISPSSWQPDTKCKKPPYAVCNKPPLAGTGTRPKNPFDPVPQKKEKKLCTGKYKRKRKEEKREKDQYTYQVLNMTTHVCLFRREVNVQVSKYCTNTSMFSQIFPETR